MRVLMIAPEPFFQPHGTPISVCQRLRALSSLSIQVDLVTYHVGEDIEMSGVTLYRIPKVPFIKHVKIGPSWKKPLLDIIVFFKALWLLMTNQYDVIHSHEEAAFIAMFLSKVFRTPHLYDMHSSLPRQLENFRFGNWWWLIRTFELLERWVLKTCDAVITIGVDLEEYVHQINPSVPCITIQNVALHDNHGSLISRFAEQLKTELNLDSARNIVYTGTFEPYQGLDLLINCVESVAKRVPDIRFVLVGGNQEQIERLQIEVQANNLNGRVIFTGIVTPEKALAFLDIAEVLVSPRVEGTSVPLKIFSYLHAGKPIVATRLLAHTQVLTDEVAILVEPSSEALAEGISICLSDPKKRQILGDKARQLAEKEYSYNAYLTRMKKIYSTFCPVIEPFTPKTSSDSPIA